jgi:lysophospholipase L1-like esterase
MLNRFRIHRKEPFVLGLALVTAGLVLRRLIELTLTADARIESPAYLAVIVAAQIVAAGAGAWLLLQQPAVRLPGKAEILLPVISLALTFLLLEVGARLWLRYLASPAQYDRYVLFTSLEPAHLAWAPHPYLSYAPTPGYHKGLTSHNSQGYRNREFPLAKPAGVFRIVALGGSSTYDVRIEDNAQTFTAQLERLLREEYGYENVEVINAGVPGYNSWEILVNLEFRVLDVEPDLIIVYEGTNDVHARLVAPAAYRGDNSGRRQAWRVPPVALWEHSALLRIVSRGLNLTRQVSVDDFVSAPTFVSWPFEDRLAETDLTPEEILRANPPTFFQRNLENIVAVAHEHEVEVLLATWAHSPLLNDYASQAAYQAGFRENNQVVIEVAESHGVALYDFAAVMSQDRLYWADGRHVNEAGALKKAELFAEFLDANGLIEAPASAAALGSSR